MGCGLRGLNSVLYGWLVGESGASKASYSGFGNKSEISRPQNDDVGSKNNYPKIYFTAFIYLFIYETPVAAGTTASSSLPNK